MKTNYVHKPNKTADFVINRDIFGQVKNMKISVFKKLRYHPQNAPDLNVTYANLGIRFFATLIDIVAVLGILLIIETFFLDKTFPNFEMNSFRVMVFMLIWLIYFSILQSSVFQGTIGEIAMKLKVVDLFGKKLGFLRALSRCLSMVLSVLPFGFGIWYITTDPKRQSWHDLIAGTFVVNK